MTIGLASTLNVPVPLPQRDRINVDGQREREETRSWNASELILDFTFD